MSLQNIIHITKKIRRQLISHENRYALRLLVDTVRIRWHYLIGAILLGVGSAFFESNTMAILAIAVSILIGNEDDSLLESLGPLSDILIEVQASVGIEVLFVLLVALGALSQVIRSAMDFGNQTVASFLSVHVETNFQKRLFDQYMAISYDEFMKFKLGDITSLLNYTNNIGLFVRSFNLIIVAFITILFYIFILFWLSPVLLATALVLLLPLGFLTRRSMLSIRNAFREAFKVRTDLNEHITEYLQAGYLIRTYAREDYARGQVNDVLHNGEQILRRGYIWHSLNTPLFESVSVLMVSIFLLLVVFLLPDNATDLSLTLAFLAILWRLSRQTSKFNSAIAQLNRNWAQVQRITSVLREDDKNYLVSSGEKISHFKSEIVFDDVTLIYDADDGKTLDALSIRIPKGKTIALAGESGSGKSSIVSLLLRLYDPTNGAVLVDGRDLRDIDSDSWRDMLGYVSQETFIFNDTIRENIRFGRLDASDEDIENAARLANAHHFIMSFANGYDTIVGERGTRLSGGQRQRITLARALVRDVDILILDEATSALDSESEKVIQDTLFDLYGKRTIIVVAHRLSTIQMADQILVLDDGQVIESGTHEELLATEGKYHRLWHLQIDTQPKR